MRWLLVLLCQITGIALGFVNLKESVHVPADLTRSKTRNDVDGFFQNDNVDPGYAFEVA
ncbi:MAG: hypothetical protein ACKVU2_06050 [Saprospiraceae bacterium]